MAILSSQFKRASLWVMVAGLAACSSQPNITEITNIPSPEQWQTSIPAGVQLNTDEQAQQDLQSISRWWLRLQDPTLNQLLDITLANNLSLNSTGISYQIAQLQAGVASAKYRPKGNAGLGASHSESQDNSVTTYNASLSASWELDLWGAGRAQRDKADATVLRSLDELHAAQVSLVAQVVQTYISLRNAQAQQQLATDVVKLREQDYQLAQFQHQAGLTTQLAEVQALASLRQAEASVQPHKKSIATALQQLQTYAGGDISAIQAELEAVQELPSLNEDVVSIAADALRQRPDVRAKEQAIYEQSAALYIAKTARYPSFSLSGSLGTSDQNFADIFDVNAIVSRLAANLSMVLFDGGTLRRAVEVQKLQLEQSLLQYRNTLLTAQQEASSALTTLSAAQQQRESYRQALEAADLAADLSDKQYQAGLLDMSKLISAKATQLSNRGSWLNNQSEILNGWVQLYRSLGGGWQEGSATIATNTTGESGE